MDQDQQGNIVDNNIEKGIPTHENINTTNSNESVKKSPPPRKLLSPCKIISIITIVIVIAAIVIAKMTGIVYFGFKSPDQRVILQTRVCTEDIFNRYNEILRTSIGPDGDDQDLLASELRELASKINNKDNSDKDPTCQFMLYSINMFIQEFEQARVNVDRWIKLHADGHFVDDNAPGAITLNDMVEQVRRLTDPPETTEERVINEEAY